MRRDWTRLTLLDLLKALFLPVLLLIFLIMALQMLHEQEQFTFHRSTAVR